MDLKRIVSGFIVGIALLVIILIPNNIITGILFTIIAIISMKEYLDAISKICKPIKWLSYSSCLIVGTVNIIPEEYFLKVILMFIPSILLILFSEVIATDMKKTFKDLVYTFLGICYISFFMIFLTLLDKSNNGKILLGYVFIAAWGTDVFAYTFGKRIGKHKFSKVSPKKSIEGCIAGTLSAVILTIVYVFILNRYFLFEYSYLVMGIIGMVLSLLGQIGDFGASAIKRYVDVKDYSKLLPGHGGMLDRIDSVLFIAPFAFILLV